MNTLDTRPDTPVEFYPPVTPASYRLKFTEVAHPVHPALHLIAELVGLDGQRFWAAWGNSKTELFEKAACWLDDAHGRAGHTPEIILAVSDEEADTILGPLFADRHDAHKFFGLADDFQYSDAQVIQYIKEYHRSLK